MATTVVQNNNKLIKFRKEIMREFIRENPLSPYMGTGMTAIIRIINDLKQGGEQINVPLIVRLKNTGKASGTLRGNEEAVDNYGFRCWIDWARNAITVKKSEQQKSSIDLWGQNKPLLSDWGKEKQIFETVDALYALPSEAAPAGLNSDDGQRVNGILFDAATAAQRNTWITDNADRFLFGNSGANLVAGNFAASCANVTNVMTLSAAIITRIKRAARKANPRITPYRTEKGREYYLFLVGQEQFRDCQNDATIITANTQARAREGDGMKNNPLFQDGDLLYNGVIIREHVELSLRLPVFYATAGSGGVQIAPGFFMGRSAMAWCWGQTPQATFLKEDDYQFIRGTGIEMAYGIAKIAKKNPTNNLKEWGIFTWFGAAIADT